MKTLIVLNDPGYGYYNLERMVGTLLRHGVEGGQRLVDGARRSSLEELADWTVWADKVVAF